MPDGLRLAALDWRPGQDPQTAQPWRILEFFQPGSNVAFRTERVSVASGYRAMYAYPDTDYFANVRIEQSVPGSYESDRRKVIDHIMHLHASQSAGLAETLREHPDWKAQIDKLKSGGIDYFSFERGDRRGFEYVSHTTNVIGLGGGTLSQIQIFVPKDVIIVTAYLLVQAKDKTKFSTIDEFLRLRQQFLEAYLEFLANGR